MTSMENRKKSRAEPPGNIIDVPKVFLTAEQVFSKFTKITQPGIDFYLQQGYNKKLGKWNISWLKQRILERIG